MSDEQTTVQSETTAAEQPASVEAVSVTAEAPAAVEAEAQPTVEAVSAGPVGNWTPEEFLTTAKATADVLCSHVELALSKDNPAAIRFREDVTRLLEQIELEVR